MKGSQESLTTVVTKEAANWPTPDASNHRDGAVLRTDNNLEQGGFHGVSLHHAMTKYGQAAPANPSTDGSRQESWEPSQQNWQTFAHGTHNRGETPHRQVVRALVNGEKVQTQCLTVDQVFAEEIKGTNKQEWRTPTVAEEKNQGTSSQIYLQNQVGATPKQWATPNTMDCLPSRSYEAMKRQAVNGARKNRSKPGNLREQIDPLMCQAYKDAQAEANQWATPQASDHVEGARTELTSNQKCLGRDMKQWATPIMGDSHLASTPEVAQKRIEEGKVTLSRQMAAQWATPRTQMVRDGGPRGVKISTLLWGKESKLLDRSNIEEQVANQTGLSNAKLNPRWVETLMGLPVGWTMPSCASPVIIALMSCDYSETESCQQQQNEHFDF